MIKRYTIPTPTTIKDETGIDFWKRLDTLTFLLKSVAIQLGWLLCLLTESFDEVISQVLIMCSFSILSLNIEREK